MANDLRLDAAYLVCIEMLPRFQPPRSQLVSYQGADTTLQSAVRRTIGLPCMGEAKASICCLQFYVMCKVRLATMHGMYGTVCI